MGKRGWDKLAAVTQGDPLPNLSPLKNGRLDDIAARHGVTVGEVRRMMSPQQIERPGAVVDTDELVRPSQASEPPMTADEEPFSLDDGRLEELAVSLGVTVGDARRMVELAPRRTYRGRLDLEEIRRRYEAGESLAEIGAAMGASDTTVRNAMVRVGIPTRPGPRPAGERRGPLHRLDVDEIRHRRKAGEKIAGSPGPSVAARAGSRGRSALRDHKALLAQIQPRSRSHFSTSSAIVVEAADGCWRTTRRCRRTFETTWPTRRTRAMPMAKPRSPGTRRGG